MSEELQSLSEIFNNRIFRVPDYQRGYAWRNEQLTDFREDVVNLPVGKTTIRARCFVRASLHVAVLQNKTRHVDYNDLYIIVKIFNLDL